MNKKITLSIIASAFVVGAAFYGTNRTESAYSPRVGSEEKVDGYLNYLKAMRANQLTGVVSAADIDAVRSQIKRESAKLNKVEFPMKWEFAGPDNIGGRTKSLVIDKDNPNILYTGGVSGGIFRSTNRGASWYPITLDADYFGISCMAQTSTGAVFAGTGERGIVGNIGGQESSTPSFGGSGIYMSTDGETFTRLNNTGVFGNINCMVPHPSGGLLIGTTAGLRFSDNDGQTWSLIRSGSCKDIAVNSNGNAVVHIGSVVYRVNDVKNAADYTVGNIIQGLGSIARAAASWSKTDPNYCYLVTVGQVSTSIAPSGSNFSGLTGFYRSTDAGQNWTEEVNEASTFFAPFANIGNNTQGVWDMAIAVHPEDKDRVFIGGVEFAEWSVAKGPEIVGSKFGARNSPFTIHSDKHHITFDESGEYPVMYICTDGGIYRTTNEEMTNYAEVNTGFATTQFYDIAAGRNGRLLGGTQDQSTILITNQSFPRKKGIEVIGGDGFQAAISQYNPDIMFGESYNGTMRRSTTGGTEMATVWDNRIRRAFNTASQPTTQFNTAFGLWEEPRFVDSALLYNTTKTTWDTTMKSRLFMAFGNGVYVCNNALRDQFNEDEPSNERVRWFRVSTVGSSSNFNQVSNLTASYNGDHLFVGRSNGAIYRVSNLNAAAFDTVTSPNYSDIPAGITTTDIKGNLNISGRFITSIATDPSDENRVVITLGNYNNATYVFETTNALDSSPTWRSLQNNLPRFPVYHAVIDFDDPDVVIVGTEYGMWATQNASATNPTWSEVMDGVDVNVPFPSVPVFSVQLVRPRLDVGTVVYGGTHGMGIWKSGNLRLGVKDGDDAKKAAATVSAYPNPAHQFVNLQTDIKGAYNVTIYSLNGEVVYQSNGASNGTIRVNTLNLTSGNYFVEIIGDNSKAVSKIIVQH